MDPKDAFPVVKGLISNNKSYKTRLKIVFLSNFVQITRYWDHIRDRHERYNWNFHPNVDPRSKKNPKIWPERDGILLDHLILQKTRL